MRICVIEGCDRKHKARGWCKNHYSRWLNHGDPEAGGDRYASTEESFQARVRPEGDCLVWTGAAGRKGHGLIAFNGKAIPVHRYAWMRAHGDIPDGKMIDHACRNPPCVNVDHLRLATHEENSYNLAGPQARNKLGLRNISPHGTGYRVQVGRRGAVVYRAYFGDLEAAKAAAAIKRAEIFGEYAGRG